MTEVLIDTGVNSTIYNTSAAATFLLHNAIASMLCISSNPLGLLQGVFAYCHGRFIVLGSDTGGLMPERLTFKRLSRYLNPLSTGMEGGYLVST